MRRIVGLLLLGILVPACGGGGGGGGGGGTPPVPFTVVQRVPGNLATGVVRTATLYVRLNRAAAAGVNSGNVNLTLNGNPVLRSVVFDAANLLVVIDPTNPLDASATYTVSLTAGITDAGGVPLTPDTFTFTTSANADTTPPAFGTANFANPSSTTSQLNLTWQAATDASAISYELFILPSSGVFDPTSTPNKTTANVGDFLAGLNSNTRHNLRLRARDAAGNLSAELHALNNAKTLTSFTQDVYNGIINNAAFVSRCTRCHTNNMPLEIVPFTMESAAVAYGNLFDVDAVCALGPGVLPPGTKRVKSGGGQANRDASFLYQKITAPICGERMPRDGADPGQRYLNNTEIQTIGDWIMEGAANN